MNKILSQWLPVLALTCVAAQAAPILQVEDGILTGAKHVEVAGAYYDVEFIDGTCIALFNGCNSPANFTINTKQEADLAAYALVDQVLVDGPAGQFDLYPNLIRGCYFDNMGMGVGCSVVTPYSTSPGGLTQYYGEQVYSSWVRNHGLTFETHDYVGEGSAGIYQMHDVSIDDHRPPFMLSGSYITFARWTESTPEPTSVPEPSMLALLSIGLLGVFINRRKLISK